MNDQEPQGHNPESATSDELIASQLIPEATIDTATVDGSATRAFQVLDASKEFSVENANSLQQTGEYVPAESDQTVDFSETANSGASQSAERRKSPTFDPATLPAFEERFDIVGRIGKGGMGVVLRVFDRNTGAELAAKFSLTNSSSAIARFKKEIAIAAKLTKTGFSSASNVFQNGQPIVLSKDLTIPPGSIGYSMRLVDGVPFSDIIRVYHKCLLQKPTERDAAQARTNYEATLLKDYLGIDRPIEQLEKRHLGLMLKRIVETHILISRSVGVMHKEGLIHRDLKPDNVLVEKNTWNAILLDYGLAREDIRSGDTSAPLDSFALDRNSPLDTATQFGTVMGTFQYMAPEQATGKIDEHSPKTDVFALGSILYFIVSGHHPLPSGLTAKEALHRIQECSFEPCKRPGLPLFNYSDLESICIKAMAKNPSSRYADIQSLVDDLTRWKDGRPVQAYLDSAASRLSKLAYKSHHWIQSHPESFAWIKAAGVFVGGLAITASSYLFYSSRTREQVEKSLAPVAQMVTSSDPEQWQKAKEALVAGNSELAFYTFDPSSARVERTNQSTLAELKLRLDIHENFIVPAYDAIAGSTSDYGTSRGIDKTVVPLKQLLEKYCPGYDQPGVAASFLNWVEEQKLPEYEEKQCKRAAGQMLLNLAFKLPFHPIEGLRNKDEAKMLLVFLKNAREILGDELIGRESSMSELYLERRARVATGEIERVAEIDGELRILQPKCAMDYHLHGKYVQVNDLDYPRAVEIFSEGILKEQDSRVQLLAGGKVAEAELAAANLFGLGYAQGSVFTITKNFSDARQVLEMCRIVSQGLLNREAGAKAEAMVLGNIAATMQAEYSAGNKEISEARYQQIRKLFKNAHDLSPESTLLLLNWGVFEYKTRQNYSECLNIYNKALQMEPQSVDFISRRALINCENKEIHTCLKDVLNALTIMNGKEISTDELDIPALCRLIKESVVNNDFAINQVDLIAAHNLAWVMGRCSELIASDGGDASQLIQACFVFLENGVEQLKKQHGYGKDKFVVPDGVFFTVELSDENRFKHLVDEYEALPEAAPYIAYH